MKKDKTASAGLRQRAEDLLNKKIKSDPVFSDADTIKLIHELEVHQIELELQKEELKLAKINADVAVKKYTNLFDFAPSGYFTLSREGNIIEANFLGAEMLGKTRSELKNKRFAIFISKDCKAVFNTFLGEVFKSITKKTCELVLQADDSIAIHAILSGIAIEETDRCTITIMDITERKLAEKLLQRSEQLLNATGEMAKVGGWEIDLITQTLTWTKEVYRIHELDEDFKPTVAGTIDFYAPGSKPIISAAVQEAIEFGKMFDLELQIITANGTLKWIHAMGQALVQDGKVSRVTGTFQDINERKLISEVHEFLLNCGHTGTGGEFFESLAKFLATLLEIEYVCIDHLKGDGLTAQTLAIYNEGKYETNVSYALKETPCGDVIGKNICCFPENVCNLFPNDHALQDLKAVSYIGTTLWSFDGRPIGLIALIGQKPLKNAALAEAVLKQVAIRAAGELERKQAEDKLLRSEKELLKAQQIAHLGSWYLDVATNQVVWTVELYKMYGFDPTLPPPPYNEHQKLFTAESWETLSSSLARTRETGMPYELELNTLRQDGSNGWMWVRGETVHDKDGKTIGLWGAAQDITERKQAEKQLSLLSERQEAILDAVPDILMDVDNSRVYAWANQAGIDFFGDDVIGKEASFYFEGEQETYTHVLPLFNGSKDIICLESWQRRKDGAKRLLSWTCRSIKDEQGKVQSVLSSALDITERKLAEASLKKNEAKLTEAMRIAKLGAWEYDVLSDQFTFNDQFYSLFNTTAEQEGGYVMSSAQYAQKFVHPGDMAMVGAEIQKDMETSDPDYNALLEHRIVRVDGSVGHISVLIRITKDGQGRTIKTHGVNQDITERKKAEEQLKDSRDYLDKIINTVSSPLFVKDNENKFLLVNDALCKLLNIKALDLFGNTGYEHFPKEQMEGFLAKDKEVLETGIENISEEFVTDGQGEIRTIITRKSLYTDPEGKKFIVGVINDITKEKQYNQMITQAVIDSEDKQRLVFAQELHDGLGPMLATIKLFLRSIHNKKEKENIEHLIDRVNEIIDASIIILKELSLNLSPHILTNHGINNAVKDFLNRTKVDNITVKFKSDLNCRLSNPLETGLYRIITELITNSVKHSGATQINILIKKTDSTVKLGYSDNGCGFDLDSMLQTSKGNGLFNIINRVKSLGATPEFMSSYGNGFSFNAKIKT